MRGLYWGAPIRPVKSMRSLLPVVLLALTACGQPGDLYLPETETGTPVPEVAPEPAFDPLDEAGADETEEEAESAESPEEPETGPGS